MTENRIRQKNKQSLPTCIIRVTSLSDHGRFTTGSQVSDTLQHIMRDTRHTFPTVDWFLISYAINCVQIPTTLLAYLENTRYHRQCYLRYTGNLIHLEDGRKLLSPTPRRRHSTPKSSSARSNLTIFAPDGILCEKIKTKCGDLLTKRAEDFAHWKNKENAWKQIAPRAEKIGLLQYHRVVKDTELFATLLLPWNISALHLPTSTGIA